MFKHEKMLFHPVEVERPNPQYAALLQEQLDSSVDIVMLPGGQPVYSLIIAGD